MTGTQVRYATDDDGVPVSPRTSCCDAAMATGYGEPRCVKCGHRQPVNGRVPVETRRKPPWKWPGELLGRYRAKHLSSDEPDYSGSQYIGPIVLVCLGMAIYAVIMATVAFFIT